MKTALQFDFTVDKENKTITVKREFNANLELVWKAWTTAELLDRWWAPKPWVAKTKSMDFREGGQWLYAMVSPENEKHWSRLDYEAIERLKSFSALDAFCDENGEINTAFGRTLWKNEFSENKVETTTVSMTLRYDSLENLEKHIEMGFKEGFTMGLNQLDELLKTLKNGQ